MWFLNLIRWKNLLIILVMQVLIFTFACQEEFQFFTSDYYTELMTVCIATLCVAGAGNIVNDIYDRKIDDLNKPGINAVGRRITASNALLIAVALDATGIFLGVITRFEFGVITILTAGLLWLYSYKLKCIPLLGNLVVAICMGLSVWVVNYSTDFCAPLPLGVYLMFAMITGLVREIVKDIEDIEGDRENGCRTIAVFAGIPFAKTLAAAVQFFGTLLIAYGCYYLIRDEPGWHLIYFAAAVILPMLILFAMIILAKTKKDYGRISAGLKLIMLAGLLYLPLAYYL